MKLFRWIIAIYSAEILAVTGLLAVVIYVTGKATR